MSDCSNILVEEIERKNAENNRKAAETERQKAENNRRDAESEREIEENVRSKAEEERENAEISRQKAESNREIAENERAIAESFRADDEEARKANEAARQKIVGDLDNALDAIIDTQKKLSSGVALATAYPVGSIYISANSTSPAAIFGGTWEALKDRFLVGAGNLYSGTGGGAHTHTLDNAHANISFPHGYSSGGNTSHTIGFYAEEKSLTLEEAYEVNYYNGSLSGDGSNAYDYVSSAVMLGGNTDEELALPPYVAVYMWKRTA